MGNRRYQNDGEAATSGPGFGITLHQDLLSLPHRWKSPRTIFVNSMSDLFHKEVPDGYIIDVFNVMAETPRHTYQVLTKRSQRLAKLAPKLRWSDNVWMGVSVELDSYCFRVRHLQQCPANIRFVSAEPLLGPLPSLDLQGLDWVIAGGESGHGARPMHPSWARQLRDRCTDEGVAFFFKQWGSWAPDPKRGDRAVAADGSLVDAEALRGVPGAPVRIRRVTKKAAGRKLDGRTWDEMPQLA
jgi:protein gp37